MIGTNDHAKSGRWSAWNPGVGNAEMTQQQPGVTSDTSGLAFSMPQVASSWVELLSILESKGSSAAGAIA